MHACMMRDYSITDMCSCTEWLSVLPMFCFRYEIAYDSGNVYGQLYTDSVSILGTNCKYERVNGKLTTVFGIFFLF